MELDDAISFARQNTKSVIATAPDDAAVEELVRLYRSLGGEHDNWDEHRPTTVADRRVLARIGPTRAYGVLRARRASAVASSAG